MSTPVTREILDMAAKAGGVPIHWYDGEPWIDQETRWDPEHNDGDALRLMVDCALKVEVYRENACRKTACVEVFGYETRRLLVLQQARNNDALHAATRLAITRAAALVGRAMP